MTRRDRHSQSGHFKGSGEASWFGKFGRAVALLDRGNYVAAIREFSAAVEVAQKFSMFEQLTVSLSGLADAYKNNNNFVESENSCKRAIDVALNNVGEHGLSYGSCLATLGELYLDNDKLDEGLVLVARATLIFWSQRDSLPLDSMATIMTCFTLFLDACVDAERIETADHWSRDIYEFSKQKLGEADVQTVTILLICLMCALSLNQEARVESIALSARQMLKDSRRYKFTNKLGLNSDTKTALGMIERFIQQFQGANSVPAERVE